MARGNRVNKESFDAYMQAHGMTLEKLVDKTKLDIKTVKKVAKAEKNCDYETLETVAKALAVTYEQLTFRPDVSEKPFEITVIMRGSIKDKDAAERVAKLIQFIHSVLRTSDEIVLENVTKGNSIAVFIRMTSRDIVRLKMELETYEPSDLDIIKIIWPPHANSISFYNLSGFKYKATRKRPIHDGVPSETALEAISMLPDWYHVKSNTTHFPKGAGVHKRRKSS